MDNVGHLEKVTSSLYEYRKSKFLCDLVFLVGDDEEVYAHSNVVAASSVKLKAAFEQCDTTKGNSLFRLTMKETTVLTMEVILLYMYTGSLSSLTADTFNVTEVISAGQKLGMDPTLLTECVSALLAMADASHLLESLPVIGLSDEDLCLEVIDKATAFDCGIQHVSAVEQIRVTSAIQPSTDPESKCVTTDNTSDVPQETNSVGSKRALRRPQNSTKQLADRRTTRVCEFCGKSYKNLKEYVEHSRIHTGEKPYKCETCGKAFGRRSSYREHVDSHNGKSLQCDLCGKRYTSSRELRKHIRLHAGEVLYRCELCGKKFNHHSEFTDHKRLHNGQNACPVCNKQFTRQHTMREHMSKVHSGRKKYECEVCGKLFSYSSGRRYHRRLHREQKLFQCLVCKKSFYRESELKRHNTALHNS